MGTAPEELALTLGCDDTGSGEGRTTTDWSVMFGSGIDYHRGVLVLSLDARYGFGLVELGAVSGLKNRGGTVALGVRVPGGAVRWGTGTKAPPKAGPRALLTTVRVDAEMALGGR